MLLEVSELNTHLPSSAYGSKTGFGKQCDAPYETWKSPFVER